MKIGILLAAGVAATLMAGCSETGRRGSGYERRTVVIDSAPRYERRADDRRVWERREIRRDRREDRRAERREDRRDDDRDRNRRDDRYRPY